MSNYKPQITDKQRRIIQELFRSRVGLTPYDISKRTGISWVTVKKHIEILNKKKIVKCPKITGSTKKICKLNFDLIYGRNKK
jgi:predicted ArsR family transcriptional regulator